MQNWYARQVQRAREQPYQPISLYRAIAAVETDTRGRFRFDTLEEKVYDLSVVATDLLPRRLENVAVGQGTTHLTVVLESGMRVEGQVFSSLTGSAVSDAIVTVGKGAKRRRLSQTDRDGWYGIGGLLEKEIDQLTVRAEGFALSILDGIDVPAGSQVRRLDLALDPAVRVSGTVIDPAGIPVAGAWVHVEPVEQSLVLMAAGDEQYARDLRLVLRVSAQSDAAGYFELDNVNPASSLELCVRHPEFQPRCIEPFEGISGQRLSAFQIQLQ
ncbi:MAG: carboxypeptidase regulatory-like domain-containing protein [Proteobacteria bacterium]|nr:carboxypeptidase regulatory-like domain-containing protein [Pseudomonadota bacterium]